MSGILPMFGGFGKPKKPKPTPAAPTKMSPEVLAAAEDQRRRLGLMKGRSASNVTGGMLKEAPAVNAPILKDRLG